uniref:Ig-like domain-containing protein n=1 Tax=Angiostrongylus cantonensis TaxID=6313 RepID=A0A158P7S7_ANGCA
MHSAETNFSLEVHLINRLLDLSNNSLNDDQWLNSHVVFPSVKKLILEHNDFTRADRRLLMPFPRIEELFLGHNRISFIGYDSLRMPHLRYIRLNDNNIQTLGMHAFRYIPQLQELDLSGNILERFMLEVLDLSSNNLTHLPGIELQSMEGLRTLLLSRNPIKSIGEDQAKLSSLQMLDLSSSEVHVVEAGAFSRLPRLHSVTLANCHDLRYISPAAFENITIFSLDISGTRVKTLSPSLLSSIARIHIADAPLDCGCLNEQLNAITTTTITDWDNSTCLTRKGQLMRIHSLSPTNLPSTEGCRPSVILPFGHEVVANVGETFKIYCAGTYDGDIVKWKTPSGITENAVRPEIGVSSVHLAWNRNLEVQAIDRVSLQVNSTSAADFKRVVLLSLHNIYCSYNLINLLPNRVYTICLRWSLTDDGTDIYSVCLSERTRRSRSIAEDLGVEGITVIWWV